MSHVTLLIVTVTSLCVCLSGATSLSKITSTACKSNPCLNGGSCTSFLNNYMCNCPAAYRGYNCQLVYETKCHGTGLGAILSTFSCYNGATCDLKNRRCSCRRWFSGKNCEIEPNRCSKQPCLNGGVCNNIKGGYTCTCQSGFTGPNCQSATATIAPPTTATATIAPPTTGDVVVDPTTPTSQPDTVDHCASVVCYNDGKCEKLSDGTYGCNCPPVEWPEYYEDDECILGIY